MSLTLERVGARVATMQDRALSAEPLVSTDRVLEGIARRNQRAQERRSRLILGVAAVLTVLVIVTGIFNHARRGRPAIAAKTQPAVQPLATLGVKQAEKENVPLAFEDGTKIAVLRGAVAEIKELRPHGALIALEHGAIDVNVVHTAESRWDLKAGPFGILVTGTRFVATWDAESKRLTVAMAEGTVKVSGPCVNESLSAPATKTFDCGTAAAPPAPAVQRVSDLASASPVVTARPGHPSAPPPRAQPQWRADLDRGDFQAAIAVMSPSDLDVVMAKESASSLVGLADAARLSGNATAARALYNKIRERFPRTEQASKSAFLLGRMADASGSPDDAARWFETASREPGSFAQEALGRHVELEQRRGRSERARELAVEYVKKYPKGPHAAYASSILEAHP